MEVAVLKMQMQPICLEEDIEMLVFLARLLAVRTTQQVTLRCSSGLKNQLV